MALPKITSPIFTVELPSSGSDIKFRQFTVKEEKILLLAAEAENGAQIVTAIKQVLTNCIIDDVDVDNLASFDIEYLYLQMRSKSIDNILKLKIVEEDVEYFAEVNLDDVQVIFDESHSNKIVLNDEVTITMKYPSIKSIEKMSKDSSSVRGIKYSIDKVVVGENLLSLSDYSDKEIEEFVESFSSKNMSDIQNFFKTSPVLKHTIEYKSNSGDVISREVVGLLGFFTLV